MPMYCFFLFTIMEAIMFIYFLYETSKAILLKRKTDKTTSGVELQSTSRYLNETLNTNDLSI